MVSPLRAFQDALLTFNVAARFNAIKLSMSLEEAKKVLGFPPNSNPSDSEVESVRRKLVLKHHPDRGGDERVMAQINAAADILKGQLTPDRGAPPSYEGPANVTYDPEPEVVQVTFEEAKSKAGFPAGVEWKFVTGIQREAGYSSEEFHKSSNFWVAYGKTDSKHVFVGMSHLVYESYALRRNDKKDVWILDSLEVPDSPKSTDPAWLYGNVIKALKAVGFKGTFNSKVIDATGWKLNDKFPKGNPTSIKHWLADSGTVSGDDPRIMNRKHVVELVYRENSFKEEPGLYKIKHRGRYEKNEGITLVINGKEFPLGEADVQKVCGGKALDLVFGTYYYDGSKKNLTRAKNGKKLLAEMATSFTTLPQNVRDVLAAAAAQMKA
jgi:hypothetical protein